MNKNFRVSYLLAAFTILASTSPSAQAAKFANQFVEFELPPQWECVLEGAEWVCQSKDEMKKRDAIIVLAAKLKGDQDSLDQYLSYLKASKTYTSVQGKSVKSDPKYAKSVNLNNHPWVDSLHLESEIPGFYTRYLATVKQDIGVLVTYSINKNKYQAYLNDFDSMVKTLKVFHKPGGINTAATNPFANAQIPQGITESTVFPGAAPAGGSDQPVAKRKSGDNSMLLLLGLIAVVGFIIWKKRRG